MTVQAAPHDHLVSFYDDEEQLAADTAGYFADAIRASDAVISISTPAHRAHVERALADDGIDVGGARYVALDAREVLASFMEDGRPSRDRFRRAVAPVIEAARKGARRVRAFGEMVALLWEDDNPRAVIDLEQLWNDLATDYEFTLHCAYPLASFATNDVLRAVTDVCHEHDTIAEPSSYVNGKAPQCPEGDDASRVFVPTTAAVTAARRFAGETLTTWGELSIANDASIVISELATNAVLHATSAFSVALTRGTDDVRITVRDVDAQAPVSPERNADTVGGLGLVIVERLASKWGTELLPDGKAVWCEFVRRD